MTRLLSFPHWFSAVSPDNSGSNHFSFENTFSIFPLKCCILKGLRQKLCFREYNRRVLPCQQSWTRIWPHSWPFLCVKRGILNWCRLSLLRWSSWSADILNQLEICSIIFRSLNLSVHLKRISIAFFFRVRKHLHTILSFTESIVSGFEIVLKYPNPLLGLF